MQILLPWIRSNMPLTRGALSRLTDLSGVRLAASIHFEPKLLVLLEGLREKNAEVLVVPCNPDTVRESFVAEALDMNCTVTGVGNGPTAKAAAAAVEEALEDALHWRPSHTLEMGADLTVAAHRGATAAAAPSIRAAVECTRSGLTRIEGLGDDDEIRYPVYDADSIPLKNGLHNRFMVGLTTWSAFLNRTALSLHGKTVAVVGFGLVGEGLASSARHFGGSVRVVDVDPSRSIVAAYQGWQVMHLEEALATSDVIVTATGRPGTVSARHFGTMKDGAVLLNAGHEATEIDVSELRSKSEEWMDLAPFLREYVVDVPPGGKRRIRLFAEGSMANLVAGFGDSINAFDATLAVIVSALGYAMDDTQNDAQCPGLHPVPTSVWSEALEVS